MVGQAFLAVLAIALVATAGGIQGFADGVNHLGDVDVVRVPAQAVTSARPPHTDHQIVAAQAREQLFQIGQGNFLPG